MAADYYSVSGYMRDRYRVW